jgi:deazaflavin-dependent oxidoreductase (nitroreductase family)
MANRSGGIGKAVARAFLRGAVWLYRRSGGKIGGAMAGAPVLLLTTAGRRSGRPWTVPLIYQPDGDGWVIIASNGGGPRHPAWWLNLRARPEATVEIGRQRHPVTAAATTGAERERLWRLMADRFKRYDEYATKTTRKIPVVELRPR